MENQSNKSIGIILAVLLVVGIGGWVYYEKQKSIPEPALNPAGTYEEGSPESGLSDTPGVGDALPTPGSFTMAQVAEHNSKASCWTVISGFVYDLTGWVPNHPGGEQAILSLCGKDGTTAFNGQHGNNARAKSVLVSFKIGAITQ